MELVLKGLTWDHPRGYAPLVAGALEYQAQNPGLRILWERRTLREFGEAPLEKYVDAYDLLIIDHPFVGFAAAHHALVDLGPHLSAAEKDGFARDSVGPSWESYWYGGGLWAFPIDAATQVSSYRPDLLRNYCAAPPATLDDVLRLADKVRSQGKHVILPACPTDAISLFFTLAANLGHPVSEAGDRFVEPVVAGEVLMRLHALISAAHPKSLDYNPIQVYDLMVCTAEALYCPLAFGYSNYSRVQAPVRLRFSDAPAAGNRGCAGTMLGGTGIAVSAQSRHQSEAIAYARWLASPQHQAGLYFQTGGQPASLAAWTDPANNDAAGGFFSGTLATLQSAYLRPRFDGFVRFFEAAGIQINRCLRAELSDAALIEWLNAKYAAQRSAIAPRPGD